MHFSSIWFDDSHPGTGKTLLARALANECTRIINSEANHNDSVSRRPIAFFMRKGADCLSKWVGESERQLRLLFDQAFRMRPSIIFFDEIDGLAPVRSSRQVSNLFFGFSPDVNCNAGLKIMLPYSLFPCLILHLLNMAVLYQCAHLNVTLIASVTNNRNSSDYHYNGMEALRGMSLIKNRVPIKEWERLILR